MVSTDVYPKVGDIWRSNEHGGEYVVVNPSNGGYVECVHSPGPEHMYLSDLPGGQFMYLSKYMFLESTERIATLQEHREASGFVADDVTLPRAGQVWLDSDTDVHSDDPINFEFADYVISRCGDLVFSTTISDIDPEDLVEVNRLADLNVTYCFVWTFLEESWLKAPSKNVYTPTIDRIKLNERQRPTYWSFTDECAAYSRRVQAEIEAMGAGQAAGSAIRGETEAPTEFDDEETE